MAERKKIIIHTADKPQNRAPRFFFLLYGKDQMEGEKTILQVEMGCLKPVR